MGIITVRLNEDTVKELDNVAKDTGRSRGNVIKRAINFYFQEFTDLDVAITRRRKHHESRTDDS
jgi:predicted DNA-binding protein